MHLWRQTLDVQTSNTIHNMEKRLRAVCHASDANVDNVVKVSIFFNCIINNKLPGHSSSKVKLYYQFYYQLSPPIQ
jgi:enamine deaminase RidA (YjgF/YER057c/UK114 family)